MQRKKNEVEEVKFKKSWEYAVIVLSINQDVDSDLIEVTDTDRQEAKTHLIQRSCNLRFVKERKWILTLESTMSKRLKK